MTLDVATIRKEFPILDREIDGAPIVYLDSGNTSQKPRQVIDAMSNFLEQSYAPINRSSYRLAGEATDAYEHGRRSIARFINAPSADEVVFTKNATESINLDRPNVGSHQPDRWRRRRAHRDGAPRQHRAVAHAGGRARHRDPLDPAHRRRSPRH